MNETFTLELIINFEHIWHLKIDNKQYITYIKSPTTISESWYPILV